MDPEVKSKIDRKMINQFQNPPQFQPKWLRIKDVTPYCGLKRSMVFKLIEEGKVLVSRIKRPGKSRGITLVNVESLDRWIESGLA